MKDDPPRTLWQSDFVREYEQFNYGRGITGHVLGKSHWILERKFGPDIKFDRVLEVGAGSGVHLKYIRHAFEEYWMTDASFEMLAEGRKNVVGRVIMSVGDASKLSFKNASFDRLIATHVLEHLYKPHEVLREWARVLRPGGTMSIILPCDPGLLWRIGRNLGPRKQALATGIPYDYTMAREHVNSITNLVTFINYYFSDVDECWWPTRIPFSDINLIYAVNVRI